MTAATDGATPRASTFSLRRGTRVIFTFAAVFAAVAIGLGVVAFHAVLDARLQLLDKVDPAVEETERYLAALVDQETGLRAFVLTSVDRFLEPYRNGVSAEAASAMVLDGLIDSGRPDASWQEVLAAAEHWRTDYANPTLASVRAGEAGPGADAALLVGTNLFDGIRAAVSSLQQQLGVERVAARSDLDAATSRLIATLIASSVVLVVLVGSFWTLIRRSVQRPIDLLGAEAKFVTVGDVDHRITPTGPVELRALGVAMEEMRSRIVSELQTSARALTSLEQRTADLDRSNAELEQFAYVASHDLQEPLRKVASFCQLLQSRYADQLDDRANQYIDFAVDGAKRMQALINDLLAFSRVGRAAADFTRIDLADVAANALRNLAAAIEDAGAEVVVGSLPTVRGERGLLGAVFQNLIGNAIKYRRTDRAPCIDVSVSDHDGVHEFVVRDNGIGIDAQYTERIFVIFQRLHSKEEYEGTGIGLALCRKIVEYHGGQIWAATDVSDGTAIHFTLPIAGAATS